ncbi:hypothetical protein [Corynebacterium casei]
MPFLALQGGYSYAGAAGIMLTYSLASSIIQPVLGIMGEKGTCSGSFQSA